MKKAVIMIHTNNHSYNAGPKAQRDIYFFLNKAGYIREDIRVNNTSLISKLFIASFVLPHVGKRMDGMDEIIIQYPMSRVLIKKLVKVLRKYTKAKIYCVIHDIESLRTKVNDESFKQDEISIFNSVDGVIAHNNNMVKWLRINGLKSKVSMLQLFDYHNSQPIDRKINYGQSICLAGNLAKANFLEKLHLKNVQLDLYGAGLSPKVHDDNIKYHGAYPSAKLAKYLTQSYGLVWDGNSTTSCEGIYGHYIKYNAPHKASLYLSCGMPIIVWRKSGVAQYVTDNRLGIAVDSLNQLDTLLSRISFNEYKEMKQNCIYEAYKLRNGNFINRAIKELEVQ